MTPIETKVCGLTRREDVQLACRLGARYLGFIFHSASPRCISPEKARNLLPAEAGDRFRVAVLVDPSDDALAAAISAIGATHVQLHGEESPERLHLLRRRFGVPVIKAVGIARADDLGQAASYAESADFLLFDTKIGGASGGTGISFDWSWLKGYHAPLPWFLSGGLSAENIEEAVRTTGARRIDASSRLEYAPGLKDEAKMNDFFGRMSLFA